MEKIIKWISDLTPFLSPYPWWVKFVFAAWIGLGAVFFISLILARPAREPEPTEASDRVSESDASKSIAAEPSAPPRHPNPEKEVWMVIEELEFFAALDGAQVRVVANVNGKEFIYPSRAGVEWLEVGPSMSSQIFRLPPTRERYIIRFEATIRVPAAHGEAEKTGKLTSVREDVVNIAHDIPFTGRYILHTFDPVHRARSANAEADLRYRITHDPE